MDYHPIQAGEGDIEILLVASCYRNRDKLRPDGPLGSYAEFTFTWSVAIIDFVTLSWVCKVLSGYGIQPNYGAGFPEFKIS